MLGGCDRSPPARAQRNRMDGEIGYTRPMAATYLDKILAAHREAAAADGRSLDALIDEAMAGEDEPRGFRAALAAADGMAVISEVKRRSPSKGDLAPDLDPAELARAYASGGAGALSVLTDSEFFAGSIDDLQQARAAVALPVIRKDFTVSAHDVVDARLMGADAVLLIAAALDDRELRDFHDLAAELRLDALVETHDESEVERALTVGALARRRQPAGPRDLRGRSAAGGLRGRGDPRRCRGGRRIRHRRSGRSAAPVRSRLQSRVDRRDPRPQW